MNKIKFFLPLVLLIFASCNQPGDNIRKVCPDCEIMEINNTEILMATNSEGLSNFYDKTSNSFMLTNWVNAIYDEGIIFDDIIINIEGTKIYLLKSDFPKISDELIRQKLSENDNSSDENETSQNEEDKTSILNTIKSNIYVNNENGFETFLSFKEGYDDHTGTMTLSQTNCRYVFNIKIIGSEIDATFFQSTCGKNSSSTTLYYNQEENSLSMNINGQDFTFYPEF
jgi:hypothetical protein